VNLVNSSARLGRIAIIASGGAALSVATTPSMARRSAPAPRSAGRAQCALRHANGLLLQRRVGSASRPPPRRLGEGEIGVVGLLVLLAIGWSTTAWPVRSSRCVTGASMVRAACDRGEL